MCLYGTKMLLLLLAESHHRSFNQQLMEAEAESHSEALGWAPNIQSTSGRSKNMRKELKTMTGMPTEIAYLR